MNISGTLVDTKKGFAVETVFTTECGTSYIHRRLVNGGNGQIKTGERVFFSGQNTWSGNGFEVATDAYPDPELSDTIAKKIAKANRRRTR